MNKYIIGFLFLFSTFLHAANGVVDKDTVLDFENITTDNSIQEIGDFYKDEYGITFSTGSLVVVDSDDGGTGNFANEQEPGHSVAFFIDTSSLVMNVEQGFTNGFSFYYSTIGEIGSVVVYDGLDGTGKILETIDLEALGSSGDGDPNGTFDTWKSVGVSFKGTAKSASFAGVANRCAFDKISFNGAPPAAALDVSLKLKDVTRSPVTDFASGFSDRFMIEFENVESLSDSKEIFDFCDNYKFEVTDGNDDSRGAKQTECTQDPADLKHVTIDFDINFIDGQANYFENGIVKICDGSSAECSPVDGFDDFAVYGTNFNIKSHAFSFENSDWNRANRLIKNDIAYASSAIIDEYIEEESKEGVWNSIGWIKGFKLGQYYGSGAFDGSSKGLCHGMAQASVANINNSESSSWGIGGDIETDWPTQISNHEDEYKTSPKPFDKYNIYSEYSANDIESFKKIIYYFVSQESYSNNGKGNWIGTYEFDKNLENEEEREFLIDQLKSGKPFPMRFTLADDRGGHAVVSTQLIRFNTNDKWFIYDNTAKDVYSYLLIGNNKSYKITDADNSKIYNNDLTVRWNIINAGARFSEDPLNIYDLDDSESAVTAAVKSATRSLSVETFDYSLFDHISLSLIGGKYLSAKEVSTGELVPLLPVIDNLEAGEAYSDNDNVFSNKLYLPNTSTYEVTVQKDASFPFLKLFAKVPNVNGEIEIINYDNIQSAEDSDTVAVFYVGVDNADKSMQRDDADDYNADYEQIMPISITSVENLQAYLLTNSVNLTWVNSAHPNLIETVIVRKEDGIPESTSDGDIVYTGLDNEYQDSNIDDNSIYYYSVFSLSSTGEESEATSISIDTYKYSVYGELLGENGNPIASAQVTLLNSDESKTIAIINTDTNGRYSFNSLTNGTYHVNYEHDYFQGLSLNITVEDASIESNHSMVGLPTLFVEASNAFKINCIETIYWDGKNINSGQVDVKLFRNNAWETLFSNLDFADKSAQWKVTTPADENAILQISLSSDDSVIAQKEIYIDDGTINYDLNHDGKIDITDIMQVVDKWNSKLNDGKYDLSFDLNNDGEIDIVDIMNIASKWGL